MWVKSRECRSKDIHTKENTYKLKGATGEDEFISIVTTWDKIWRRRTRKGRGGDWDESLFVPLPILATIKLVKTG